MSALRALLTIAVVAALPAAAGPPATDSIAPAWQPIGPPGGNLTVLAFAPGASGVVYAATAAGSVLRSADGGATWSLATTGLPVMAGLPAASGLAYPAIFSLAIDPVDPQVVYVGNADGVWKTVDGGGLWLRAGAGLAGIQVMALAIDPQHPATVYAGAAAHLSPGDRQTGGVFRSNDGGAHWVLHHGGLSPQQTVTALAVDPQAADIVVAEVADFGAARFFRSVDGGRSWQQPRILLPISGLEAAPGFVLVAATHTIYAATFPTAVETTDFGAGWSRVGSGVVAQAITLGAGGVLYAIGEYGGIESSADGGNTWTFAGQPTVAPTLLAADPLVPGRLFAATVTGDLLRSVDGGAHWSTVGDGFFGSTITALAVDPQHPAVLWAGTDVGGPFASADGGLHWQGFGAGPWPTPVDYQVPVGAVAVRSGAGRDVWVGSGSNAWWSSDGGATWGVAAVAGCSPVTGLVADPTTPTVYAVLGLPFSYHCIDCPFSVSRDGGRTWPCAANDDGPSRSSLLYRAADVPGAVVIDPVDPRIVYAELFGNLWKSADRGERLTMQAIDGAEAQLLSLAVSPVDHQVLWAGTAASGVLRSADAGNGWTRAATGLPAGAASALVADPRDAATAYALIAGQGVYVTRDAGALWRPLGAGLPAGRLMPALAIGTLAGRWTLYAGTAGAGLFALPLP